MKTWQAVLMNVGLVFASVFVGKIPDKELQAAVAGSVAIVAGAAAKRNSETDQLGNRLPPAK